MKITHIVHGYFPAHGGTEYLVQRLSEELVKSHGDDVEVFTTFAHNIELFRNPNAKKIDDSHRQETINGVNVKRFDVSNRLWFFRKALYGIAHVLKLPFKAYFQVLYYGPNSLMMKKAVLNSESDIIMASSFPLMHMYYALLGKRKDIPVVLLGALHVEDEDNYGSKKIFNAIKQCDAYIANTSFEKDYLVERGIDEKKIHVIGVGVDIQKENPERKKKFRSKYGIKNDDIVLAFIGQQAIHKGIIFLLHAFARISKKYPKVKLVIAGAPTSHEVNIKSEIAKLSSNIRKNIIHLGKITDEEKHDIFAGCDIFVSPSCRESFGITYVEAWSHKKPIIACNILAVSSLVEEYKDGLLVQFGDEKELEFACIELIEDEKLRTLLGNNGYDKVVNNYTWEIVGKKFREVYKKLQKNI